MVTLNTLIRRIRNLNADRDWNQFHTFKDLSMSLSLEAAEVMEHFQWKSKKEEHDHLKHHRDALAEELADVQIYLLEIADKAHINIIQAVQDKLTKVEKKYPVSKYKSRHTNKFPTPK